MMGYSLFGSVIVMVGVSLIVVIGKLFIPSQRRIMAIPMRTKFIPQAIAKFFSLPMIITMPMVIIVNAMMIMISVQVIIPSSNRVVDLVKTIKHRTGLLSGVTAFVKVAGGFALVVGGANWAVMRSCKCRPDPVREWPIPLEANLGRILLCPNCKLRAQDFFGHHRNESVVELSDCGFNLFRIEFTPQHLLSDFLGVKAAHSIYGHRYFCKCCVAAIL